MRSRRSYLPIGLVAAALGPGAHVPAAAADGWAVTATTGVDFSSGKYGSTTSTDVLVFPVVTKLERGRFSARVAVPYIRSTGPATLPQTGVALPSNTSRQQTVWGLGDVTTAIGYDFYVDDARLQGASFTLSLKSPTGDSSKGLGTGETDYGAQVDFFKGTGRFLFLATVGYKVMGNPSGIRFNNIYYGSAGALYRFSNQTFLGASYDARQAVTHSTESSQSATLSLIQQVGESNKLVLYVSKGFTSSSPDYGVGTVISHHF